MPCGAGAADGGGTGLANIVGSRVSKRRQGREDWGRRSTHSTTTKETPSLGFTMNVARGLSFSGGVKAAQTSTNIREY